jgi:hypothetical protein
MTEREMIDLAFIEKNPLAVPAKALEAFKVYKMENV